jgi:predicted Zn finger-like uncharacterized protein
MAVKALCPTCGAIFELRDDMRGKMVRCTKCEQVFTVGGEAQPKPSEVKQSVQPKPAAPPPPPVPAKPAAATKPAAPAKPAAAAKAAAPAKKSSRDDDDEISTARKSRATAKRGRDDDDDDDDDKRPRKGAARRGKDDDDDDDDNGKAKPKAKKRTYHDDDDDDDDDRPRKPVRKSGGGAGMVLIIIGGAAALLLLICGGAIYGIYHVASSAAEEAQAVVDNANANNPNNGFPGGNPFQPPPEKRVASVDDALRDINSNNQGERHAALDWLARAKVDKGRQAEVARALNPPLKDPDNGTRERAANALKVWATKDNLDGLIQVLEEGDPNRWHHENGLPRAAMEALGNLQDEKAAEPIWRYRAGPSGGDADKALRTLGAAAGEKAALARMDDPNGNLRNHARSLLVYYGTKDSAKLGQAVTDLKSDNKDQRVAAAEYLETSQVVEAERQAVSQGLSATLTDAEGAVVERGMRALTKWATTANVPALIAAVEDDRFPKRHDAIRLLGKLKDVRAVPAIIKRMPTDRIPCSDALVAIGPAAKDDVLKVSLEHPDKGVREEAGRILLTYGVTGNKVATILADLKSGDRGRIDEASKSLSTVQVDEARRTEVAAAVIAAIDDKSGLSVFTVDRLAAGLGRWATKENVPAMVTKIGELGPAKPRHSIMEALGQLKDGKAVKALVERLQVKDDLQSASKALQAMGLENGKAIETEIATVNTGNNKPLLIECCRILGAVGTKASIVSLQQVGAAAVKQKQLDVAREADAAILAIKAR